MFHEINKLVKEKGIHKHFAAQVFSQPNVDSHCAGVKNFQHSVHDGRLSVYDYYTRYVLLNNEVVPADDPDGDYVSQWYKQQPYFQTVTLVSE